MMKIGVVAESFKKSFEENVALSARVGAVGIQVYATKGLLDVSAITREKIAYARELAAAEGLVFSAICGDFGGFANASLNAKRIDDSKRVLDLAMELGCHIVTTHIGRVPAEEHETKATIRQACRELAKYAGAAGGCFAVETGCCTAAVLKAFLDSIGSTGVSVNYDPANLVMLWRDDPVAGVYTLQKYIVHTHAKDGVNLGPGPRDWTERPLGQGGVDFDRYLRALHEIGYDGYLTIEREMAEIPETDIAASVRFLTEKKCKYGL